jgi:hypothetical protein
MNAKNRWVVAAYLVFGAIGFLLPFWPLSALCVLMLALGGRWFVALLLGLVLDLAWGAPVGLLHALMFPFTLLAAVSALVRLAAADYFIDRDLPERL